MGWYPCCCASECGRCDNPPISLAVDLDPGGWTGGGYLCCEWASAAVRFLDRSLVPGCVWAYGRYCTNPGQNSSLDITCKIVESGSGWKYEVTVSVSYTNIVTYYSRAIYYSEEFTDTDCSAVFDAGAITITKDVEDTNSPLGTPSAGAACSGTMPDEATLDQTA